MTELGLLKENVKDFGLGWDLLRFDYAKFDVNGSAKKKKKKKNIYIYIYIDSRYENKAYLTKWCYYFF